MNMMPPAAQFTATNPRIAKHVQAPHNIAAEQQLIGAVLVDNAAFDAVSEIVQAHHFFDPLHEELFALIQRRLVARERVTPALLEPIIKQWPAPTDDMNILQYVRQLFAIGFGVPAVAYAREIVELAARRALMDISSRMASDAANMEAETAVEDLIEGYEAELHDVTEAGSQPDLTRFSDVLATVLAETFEAHDAGGRNPGLPLPLEALQFRIGGLQPGNVYVIAARPSMGKTALAMDIAVPLARKRGVSVLFFSMEMPREQVVRRELAKWANIDPNGILEGRISSGERRILETEAPRHFADLPMIIDETPGLTLERMSARAKRVHRRHGCGLIVIDYLQLMQGSGRDGRLQDLSKITAGIKTLAKQIRCPIIVLSQLSRAVEGREDKRPQLSDLRESGTIEQDADVVMTLYREEYYLERAEPPPHQGDAYAKWQEKMAAARGMAEVGIAKNRNGSVGTARLRFNGPRAKFSDLAGAR